MQPGVQTHIFAQVKDARHTLTSSKKLWWGEEKDPFCFRRAWMSGWRLGHGQTYPLATCTVSFSWMHSVWVLTTELTPFYILYFHRFSPESSCSCFFLFFFPAVIKNICHCVGSMHSTAQYIPPSVSQHAPPTVSGQRWGIPSRAGFSDTLPSRRWRLHVIFLECGIFLGRKWLVTVKINKGFHTV